MKFIVMFLVASLAGFTTISAHATDVDGEAHVQLKNAEYVRVEVNGTGWVKTEFEQGGKLLIIKGLDTSIEHNAVTLIPFDTTLESFELDVPQTSYKKVRKGRLDLLIGKHTVTFAEKTVEPPPEDKPLDPPEPTPETPPGDDDL